MLADNYKGSLDSNACPDENRLNGTISTKNPMQKISIAVACSVKRHSVSDNGQNSNQKSPFFSSHTERNPVKIDAQSLLCLPRCHLSGLIRPFQR